MEPHETEPDATSVSDMTPDQRQDAALAMRNAGHTLQDVADQLGYADRTSARRAVQAAIRRSSDYQPAADIVLAHEAWGPGPRTARGRFTATDPDNIARQDEALRMRAKGRTLQEIADHLGYGQRESARRAVQTALRRSGQRNVNELREELAQQLEELYRVATGVIEREHLVVDKGAVVEYNGAPLLDDGPKLSAVNTARALLERMSKLMGADAPQKTQIEVTRVDFTLDGIPASEV